MKKTILILVLIPFFFLAIAQNSKSTVFTNAKEKLGDLKFTYISKIIYKGVTAGVNGKIIPAYSNEQLTSLVTPKEILQKGATEEAIQVPINKNDPNMDNPIISVFT